MNFNFSEEQLLIAASARDFAEQHIRPHVMEWDEAQTFPVELFKKAGEMGFGGGGGMTVNINVGGVTDRTDKKQLAKEIGDLIRAEMSRGGRSYGNRRSAV